MEKESARKAESVFKATKRKRQQNQNFKEMRLDENYTLEATEPQWVLKYHSVKYDEAKNKNITTQREYYFNRLNEALRSYIDKKLKECESVGEAIIMLHKELEELKTIKF